MEKLINRQRRILDRVLDRQTVRPIERAFSDGTGRIMRIVSSTMRGNRRQSATRTITNRINTMVEDGLDELYLRMGAELSETTDGALTESLRSLSRFTARVAGSRTALDDELTLQRIVREHRTDLEETRRTYMTGLHRRARDAVRLATRNIEEDQSVADVMARASDALDGQWSDIRRLVKTETSVAFNLARADGINVLAEHNPRIMKRWTEMVDDTTGQPMDKKVGIDSIVMHGQVAIPGQPFFMPPDPRAPKKMVGKRWMHPPNRPHDRAVLLPWLPEWGIPGWRWSGGRRQKVR